MKVYRAISQINNLEQKLFWVMLTGIAFLVVVYVSLINNTIMNVVARKQAYASINNINAELAVLEGKYVATVNDLTLNKAYDLGFVDALDQASFANVGGQSAVSMR
jgi:hypothetical protein